MRSRFDGLAARLFPRFRFLEIGKHPSILAVPFRKMFLPSVIIAIALRRIDLTESRTVNLRLGLWHPIMETPLRYQKYRGWRTEALSQDAVRAPCGKNPLVNDRSFFAPFDIFLHKVVCVRPHISVGFDQPGCDLPPSFSPTLSLHLQRGYIHLKCIDAEVVSHRKSRRRGLSLWLGESTGLSHPFPHHHIGLTDYTCLFFVMASPAEQDEISLYAVCSIPVDVMDLMRRGAPLSARRVRASLTTFLAHLMFYRLRRSYPHRLHAVEIFLQL